MLQKIITLEHKILVFLKARLSKVLNVTKQGK